MEDRLQFELYQATQSFENRSILNAPLWAVFVVNLSNENMFAGLYSVKYHGLIEQDTPMPHMDGTDQAESCDVYELILQEAQSDLIGKLFIDWGPRALAWIQYAERNNKSIDELHKNLGNPSSQAF